MSLLKRLRLFIRDFMGAGTMSLRRTQRVLVAAIVLLLVALAAFMAGYAGVVSAARDGRDVCHTRACHERVAMRQCSQTRPVPCIRRAALHHGVPTSLQLAIARCESRLDPTELNDAGSGAAGLMQFMPGTFAATPYGRRPILSAKWNALAGAWLLKRAGTGPWTASRGCWG